MRIITMEEEASGGQFVKKYLLIIFGFSTYRIRVIGGESPPLRQVKRNINMNTNTIIVI